MILHFRLSIRLLLIFLFSGLKSCSKEFKFNNLFLFQTNPLTLVTNKKIKLFCDALDSISLTRKMYYSSSSENYNTIKMREYVI